MFDDGAHGDALANDGVYGVVLPAQASGTIIEFYFDASDGADNVRFWPAPALDQTLTPVQSQNCLLQVDDTAYAGALPLYRIVLKPADKAELNQINRNSPSTPPFPYGPGETAADQTYSHAKFNTTWITRAMARGAPSIISRARATGGHGSRRLQPQGMSVNFPNADLWKKSARSISIPSTRTPSSSAAPCSARRACHARNRGRCRSG